ncbi:MAG: 4Fe-4S binding protein [Faecalibacterium sp.]
MNFVAKYAVQTLMKRTHPIINRKECWEMRPHTDKCKACVEICPHADDIFKRPGLAKSWDKCTDCGMCVSVCKTRCITPSRQKVDADTSPVELPNDCVWIGCTKSSRENDLVRDCIGAISWETLAYLALCKKVILDVTPCGECENEACASHLRSVLERTVDFLGTEKFEARVALAYEQDELPFIRQEFTRRDLMGKMTEGSKVNGKKMLRKMPFLQNGDDAHQYDFRKMLHDRIKYLKSKSESETPVTYGFRLPVVNDKCYGCEKCVKACKTKALELIADGEGKGKLVITAWKCSECEQCRLSCTEKAIDAFALRQITTLGPIAVKNMDIYYCPQCGKAKKPNANREMCVTCDIRERSRKRAEESKVRQAERKKEIEARKAERDAKKAAEAEAGIDANDALPVVAAVAEQATPAEAPVAKPKRSRAAKAVKVVKEEMAAEEAAKQAAAQAAATEEQG